METQRPAPVVRDPLRPRDLTALALTRGRTIAQAFSMELDSLFALDSDVDHLSQTVDQKYVSTSPVLAFLP